MRKIRGLSDWMLNCIGGTCHDRRNITEQSDCRTNE
jgi:hypothetical protein